MTTTTNKGAYAIVSSHPLIGSALCPNVSEDLSLDQVDSSLKKEFQPVNDEELLNIAGSNKFARKKYTYDDIKTEEDNVLVFADYLREFIVMESLTDLKCFPYLFTDKISEDVTIDMQHFTRDMHDSIQDGIDAETDMEKARFGNNLQAMIEQVGAAISIMHARGIYHGDIKPANILEGPNDNFALADFNKSMLRSWHPCGDSWDPIFCHPILKKFPGRRYSAKCDLWSFAASVCYILTNGKTHIPAGEFVKVCRKFFFRGNVIDYLLDLYRGVDGYEEHFGKSVDDILMEYSYSARMVSTSLFPQLLSSYSSSKPADKETEEYYENLIKKYWTNPPKNIKSRYITGSDKLANYITEHSGMPTDDECAVAYFIYAVMCKDINQFYGFPINEMTISIMNQLTKFTSKIPCLAPVLQKLLTNN